MSEILLPNVFLGTSGFCVPECVLCFVWFLFICWFVCVCVEVLCTSIELFDTIFLGNDVRLT